MDGLDREGKKKQWELNDVRFAVAAAWLYCPAQERQLPSCRVGKSHLPQSPPPQ